MNVTIDVDVDAEAVLDELSAEELAAVLARREARGQPLTKLEQVYWAFRDRGDAPEVLRSYIYDVMGKVL
jgi:hypothetical protein